MHSRTFLNLATTRLEDLANQVELLTRQGNFEDARLLRDEGLELAAACDDGTDFMYLPDFTEVR